MKKRALAAILWFFAGWYAGALIAWALGVSPYFGPILGTVAAALIAGDPFHLIWARTPRAQTTEETDQPPTTTAEPALPTA